MPPRMKDKGEVQRGRSYIFSKRDASPFTSLEADLTQREGKLRARFYLVKGRLYQLVAIGSAKWAKSDEVNKFLESLTVSP